MNVPFPPAGNYYAKVSGSSVEFRAGGVLYTGKAERFAVKGIDVSDVVTVGDGKVWSRILGKIMELTASVQIKVG